MINEFRGKHFAFSNFFNSKVKIGLYTFDNAEAAFHARKDPDRVQEFIGLTASKAKKLGRKVRLREDWDIVKDDVMYMVVKAKFEQNFELRMLLLATGDEYLQEGNNWGDKYWGICNGIGYNKLGHILMRVRTELSHG